jgi:ABC-2 type transport system ATP-binding protein
MLDAALQVPRPITSELRELRDLSEAPAVSVRDLYKSYGDATVVNGVSFDVHRGELFGLLGTNGAGKTTTVEILQGLRRPDAGRLSVLGLDPQTEGDVLRSRIGSQLQAAALPDRMRVREALTFFGALHADPHPLDELVEEWSLGHLLKRSFEALSGGERQRLFVALALIGRPQLVFLDELTQNLDPAGRRHTWDVIRRVRDRGCTVVLVTHDVEEAERLCDRIVVLHGGEVVAEGAPADVARSGSALTTVTFTDREPDLDRIARLPGVISVERRGDDVRVQGVDAVLAHIGAHLVLAGRPAADLRAEHPSLEHRFLELTGLTATTAVTEITS